MRLFFNEYYRRKPDRLWEKDGEVFCMEKGGEYDYEFISIDEHEQELTKLTNKFEKANRYIELCPCDPDIYPDQLKAWNEYQEAIKDD